MSRLPPLAKLPLNQRKEYRDEFDAKKEGLEKEISEFFGQPWKVSVDPLAIVPYAKDGDYGHHSPGKMIRDYFEIALKNLKYYKERNGADVVDEINKLCTAHTMVLDVDVENKVGYCGGRITADGNLALLFGTTNLAVNMDHMLSEQGITEMINNAPGGDSEKLSFKVRKSISERYDPEIKAVSEDINKMLGKEITLVPNFEATAKALKDANKFDDNEDCIGPYTLSYFQGLQSTLKYNKVSEDEMILEAIQEETSANKIEFVVLPGNDLGTYGDAKFEGGVLQVRTDANHFGVNIDSITQKLLDQL